LSRTNENLFICMEAKNVSYKKKVLKELAFNGASCCSELSFRIGKSLSFTTELINEMIEEGLVEKSGLGLSSGGRKPLTYSLHKDAFYLVAVAVDQLITRIGILDAQLNFVQPVKELELSLIGNDKALDELTQEIKDTISGCSALLNINQIIGIGIGMPGFVDAQKSINYSFFNNNNIGAYISRKCQLPVFIENDSSVIALAEYWFGKAKGERNAMVINIGWGVGLGMIIDGKLFRGDNGFAGEFSHIPLFQNGKLCSCGKTGCLETETSLNFMLSSIRKDIEAGKTSCLKPDLWSKQNHFEEKYRTFIEAAERGDSLVVQTISDAGYNIGRGIAILIHLFNPGKIVLSGRGAAAGRLWLAPIHRAINEFCVPRLAGNTQIEVSDLCHAADIIGAAALVIENSNDYQFDKTNLTNTYSLTVE